MLAELQANGTIISGLGFTLTEVQLLDPASLKTLNLSVPVTDNWVFAARPTLTIHVENPYDEAVTANAEVEIATDKMAAVTTLTKSIEVAAKASEEIVLTTDADLAAGFYKATCIVNDDLARAFVFGINPTAIVSAPDAQSDFAEFWATAKAQLEAIDMNAQLTEITAKSTDARKVYLVELNSVPDGLTGEPVVVRGYYCEPTDGKKHPVIMHYLGYDSDYRPGGQDVKPYCPSGDAEPDYAEFYLSTRGQSINNRAADEREADGKGDFVNTYGDWFAFNFGDKDSYYYRGAFMDCVQAIRFMATRSTSDMHNLFGEGQSQGGAFTYAAAALSDHPFRAIAPGIAFLGDFPDYFDIVNWPAYVARENQGTMTDDEMFAFLSYFDTKNLAPSISAATIACLGLQDNVCPPHTNIAPYNNLTVTDKQLIINPELMHQVSGSWYSDMMAFFAARIDNTATGIANMENQPSLADKTISNGQLIIVRNNKMYNALGQQL
jgi:cephalosporin-C deacetylase